MTETQYKKVPGSEKENEKLEVPSHYGYGVRHVQSFLLFMSLALGYLSRGHLGVTIVAMTDVAEKSTFSIINDNKTVILNTTNALDIFHNETEYGKRVQNLLNDTIYYKQSVLDPGNAKDGSHLETNITLSINRNNITEVNRTSSSNNIWSVYRTYDWPKSTQEMVQGAFFLGYFIMMFPTGLVVQRWGGKLPLQIALLVNGVVPMAIPWLTAWGGWKVLCACRLLQGFTQAGLFPAIHNLLANWVPVSERGTLNNYVYTGSGFGTIVAFQLGGVLAASPWGWPSTFWVTGSMCILGTLLLTIFGANSPAEHKSVCEKERNYILGSFDDEKKKVAKTPWKKIFSSKHVWACFSGHVGSGVTFIFFLTQFPTYMHAILHFNIRSSGLLSSLPYIFTFISTIAYGHLSDFCTNRKILSIKNARKISNTIGGYGSALCITAVAFTENPTLAVVLCTTMLSLHSAGHTGWMVNYIDLAPNFSGALMAIGNTLCNSVVISLPLVVSSIVIDVKNPYQWRIVFLLMAGLAFITNTLYVLFMSEEIQSWNNGDESNEPEEVKLEEHPEKSNGFSQINNS